jgi:class 3 adenylate cyclase
LTATTQKAIRIRERTHKELLKYIFGNSPGLLFIPLPVFFENNEFLALGIAFSIAGVIASIAAILAAIIMWRAPDSSANRQVAGILIAFASFCGLEYFVGSLPAYAEIHKNWSASIEMGNTILLVYLFLALPRFLLIFPRPLDYESVYQTYLQRPLLMRWSRRASSKVSFLPLWHRHLVSGQILWLAIAAPIVLGTIGAGIDRLISFDVWGGLAFAALVGIFLLYFVWGLPYAFASISHIYRCGTSEERQRVAWLRAILLSLGLLTILVSVLMPFVIFAVHSPATSAPVKLGATFAFPLAVKLGILTFFFYAFLPALAVIAVGFSVLHRGQLDPRLAFTRITLWSVMGVTITLAFVAIERYAAIKVVQWFNLPPDTGGIAAGAIVAGTFMPIRNFASSQINRLASRWIPLQLLAEGERVVKVVAISDLSGYTALSATNEPNAILQSAALSRQAQRIAESNGGKLVKSLGDAVMLTFADANAALNAVQTLHVEFPKAMGVLAVDPLPLHSAIHFGEIVESQDGDIFGQTVNVTARLVDAASAGEVVVSEQLRVRLASAAELESLGLRKFKNVPNPVECFRVSLGSQA